MNRRIIASFLTAGVAASLLIGCAKTPDQEINTAKAAIEAAKASEADKYASADFNAAQEALTAANSAIEKQKSAFALSRNYDEAKTALANAATLANTAKDNAAAGKEKTKADAEQTIAQATTATAEAKELLTKAPKGKEGKAALEAIQNDISTVEAGIVEASTAATSGDYLSAKDKGAAALARIDAIKAELQTAIDKTSRKGRK